MTELWHFTMKPPLFQLTNIPSIQLCALEACGHSFCLVCIPKAGFFYSSPGKTVTSSLGAVMYGYYLVIASFELKTLLWDFFSAFPKRYTCPLLTQPSLAAFEAGPT